MTGDPFVEHRDRPSPDTLVGLLRASQDSVYRLCYHVLQNAHDAEDAAQQVLLKIVDARRFEDRDRFHRWLYRVSLNAALEAARKAARRRAYESRAAMERTEPVTLKPEQRLVVFEALAALDDVSRAFLLQHYFEGQPLETIAARSGYTPSGVSRRMEKARESMRRRLGAIAALPVFESLFPSTPPPPDLVTGAVLAKAMSATATAAGGIAMSSKTAIIVAVAIAACLSVGTGMFFKRRGADPAKSQSPSSSAVLATTAPEVPSTEITPATSPPEPSQPETPDSPLLARLSVFKEWWKETCAGHELGFKSADFTNRHQQALWEHLRGLKELILGDPETFLAFLRDPDNEPMLMDFTMMNPLTLSVRPHVEFHWPLSDSPPALSRGLFDVLHTGSARQKVAAMRLLAGFPEQPGEFRSAYLTLMEDPDPEVQGFAVRMTSLTTPISTTMFEKLKALGSTSPSAFVRGSVVTALRQVQTTEADAFVLGRLEVGTESELYTLAWDLRFRFEAAEREGRVLSQELLERSMIGVINRNPGLFDWGMSHPASFLDGPRLKNVLATAAARTKSAVFRERYFKAIEMIDQGQSDRRELLRVLDPPRQ